MFDFQDFKCLKLALDFQDFECPKVTLDFFRILNAPVHLGQMVADKESEMSGANSIWIQKVDDATVSLHHHHVPTFGDLGS